MSDYEKILLLSTATFRGDYRGAYEAEGFFLEKYVEKNLSGVGDGRIRVIIYFGYPDVIERFFVQIDGPKEINGNCSPCEVSEVMTFKKGSQWKKSPETSYARYAAATQRAIDAIDIQLKKNRAPSQYQEDNPMVFYDEDYTPEEYKGISLSALIDELVSSYGKYGFRLEVDLTSCGLDKNGKMANLRRLVFSLKGHTKKDVYELSSVGEINQICDECFLSSGMEGDVSASYLRDYQKYLDMSDRARGDFYRKTNRYRNN